MGLHPNKVSRLVSEYMDQIYHLTTEIENDLMFDKIQVNKTANGHSRLKAMAVEN